MREDVNYFISLGIVNSEQLTIKLFLDEILHHTVSTVNGKKVEQIQTQNYLPFLSYLHLFTTYHNLSYQNIFEKLFKNMPLIEKIQKFDSTKF